MPYKRSSESVSTAELVQLVTVLKSENDFPKSQRGKARGELDAAVECLKQFSATTIYAKLVKAISVMTNGKETPVDFIIRKRTEMLVEEKGDAAKLQALNWMESVVRACATSHLRVQERLDIRKPAGSVGNSVGSGSPYADAMHRRKPAGEPPPV